MDNTDNYLKIIYEAVIILSTSDRVKADQSEFKEDPTG